MRQPRILRLFDAEVEQPAALLGAHRANNLRVDVGHGPRRDVDLPGQVFGRLLGQARVKHQGAADLDSGPPVAKRWRWMRLPFEEGAVGAVQVRQQIRAVGPLELGMLARDFGVVELDGVGRLASEAELLAFQLEAAPLIVAADHEQRRHSRTPKDLGAASISMPGRLQQLFDSTNQRRVVIGLGHDIPLRDGVVGLPKGSQNDQIGALDCCFAEKRSASLFGRGGVEIGVDDDDVRPMPPGPLEAELNTAGGINPASVAFQGSFQDLSVFFRSIDDQHALFWLQGSHPPWRWSDGRPCRSPTGARA